LEIIELVGQFPTLSSESFVNRARTGCATRARNRRREDDWSRCGWGGWSLILNQSVLMVSSVAGPTRNLRLLWGNFFIHIARAHSEGQFSGGFLQRLLAPPSISAATRIPRSM
jgi:hypothetical protein